MKIYCLQFENQCKEDNDSDECHEVSEDLHNSDFESSSDTTESADMKYILDDTDDDTDENEDKEHPIFKKCLSFKKTTPEKQYKLCQTDLEGVKLETLFTSLDTLENRNKKQLKEIQNLIEENFDLKAKNSEYIPFKGRVKRLESQNSVLKEKTIDIRKENDMLVEKIQTLQKRLSCEQKVRVSVSEYEETDTADDACFVDKTPDIETPSDKSKMMIFGHRSSPDPGSPAITRSGGISRASSINEEYIKNEEKRFQEAAEKIMRLEQRIVTLQNANKLNSCASCGPLRCHVMKVEKQVCTLVRERKGQLEELFELKQEALSSAVSEKDAHLAWLEVTGEGNIHTKGSIDRLRKERRELLQRMKEENENRAKLLSKLDSSTCPLFTGTIKISTLGSLGDYYSDEQDECGPLQYSVGSRCHQDEGYPGYSGYDPPSISPTASPDQEEEEDAASIKSC